MRADCSWSGALERVRMAGVVSSGAGIGTRPRAEK
jgi:hypothetical protein